MLLVTTIGYDQLASLIKNKSVSLDNSDLFFNRKYETISKYLEDRFGTDGYVMGIRGRINNASASLLSKLDKGLNYDKVLIEANVKDDEVIAFDVKGLEEAIDILSYGLPADILYNHLDKSIIDSNPISKNKNNGVQIICVPYIDSDCNIKVTSLNREITVEAEGITVVKLNNK